MITILENVASMFDKMECVLGDRISNLRNQHFLSGNSSSQVKIPSPKTEFAFDRLTELFEIPEILGQAGLFKYLEYLNYLGYLRLLEYLRL